MSCHQWCVKRGQSLVWWVKDPVLKRGYWCFSGGPPALAEGWLFHLMDRLLAPAQINEFTLLSCGGRGVLSKRVLGLLPQKKLGTIELLLKWLGNFLVKVNKSLSIDWATVGYQKDSSSNHNNKSKFFAKNSSSAQVCQLLQQWKQISGKPHIWKLENSDSVMRREMPCH